ncbi:recombinase family protein [Streptomyces finlayi]|uniref:Recombinase family protein n=1 Tax=Streptomyces finlayi TaxID=67296 RepID=A0A7G7BF73_9ACTN|nr:recombinase family protein [Streptomyces finlayi]QNE73988.1 recombinase family protein [Streptomyces finlayi]
MTTTLRGLSVLRLSVLTDETTSPERQRDANHLAAGALNIDLAGREAVDLGVSASKTTPFERPELGDWLKRPSEYDALVFWRFDRAVRSMDDMHELSKWARDNRKMIVFAEGPGGRLVLDFRDALNPMAQLMVTLFAFAAQMEAQAIRERVTGAQAAMRVMPLRWRGSRPPYGYLPEALADGGMTLVQDKKAVKVIMRIIKELMRDKTASAIAAELNEAGILSPRDHWSLIKGRKTGGKVGNSTGEKIEKDKFKWRHNTIKKLLTSETLLGWKMTDNGPVRDSEGAPIMATREPILTREEFDAVGALFTDHNPDKTKWFRVDSVAMLLRVILCDGCGENMSVGRPSANSKGISEVYKCGSWGRGEKCPSPSSVKLEWAEEYVRDRFLAAVGGMQLTETRYIPGYDPQPEIDATTAEYEAHMGEQGQQESKAAQAAWKRRATALDARLAELETREARPARTEVVQLGVTIADAWRDADDKSRRDMLREAGVTIRIKRAKRGRVFKLNEDRVVWNMANDYFTQGAKELEAIADAEHPVTTRAQEQLRNKLKARRAADQLAFNVQQLVSDAAATQASEAPEPREAVAARYDALMTDHDEADRADVEARANELRIK